MSGYAMTLKYKEYIALPNKNFQLHHIPIIYTLTNVGTCYQNNFVGVFIKKIKNKLLYSAILL